MHPVQIQIGGGRCSLCGSPNTNKSTCPDNPESVRKDKVDYVKHPNAKNKPNEFYPERRLLITEEDLGKILFNKGNRRAILNILNSDNPMHGFDKSAQDVVSGQHHKISQIHDMLESLDEKTNDEFDRVLFRVIEKLGYDPESDDDINVAVMWLLADHMLLGRAPPTREVPGQRK